MADFEINHVTEDVDAFVKETVDLLSEAAQSLDRPFSEDLVNLRAADNEGRFAGGLSGSVVQGWLFIKFLAVRPELRGSGIGAQLLARAEAIVRSRGLAGIYLDTFDFQAPKFYLREGFYEIGRLPTVDGKPQRIWFAKINKKAGERHE